MAAVLWLALSGGLALAQAPADGKASFQAKCAACHTIGGGRLVGPDLAGVTARRPREWLLEWIQRPDAVLARGDPIATELLEQFNRVPMPNQAVTEAEARALIAYLEQARSGERAQATGSQAESREGPAGSLPTGDPLLGKNLFTGAARFSSGGPSCMGCHSAAGIGALGGGALGPDLTGAVARYGGARGLTAFLAGTPTPTMSAVWSGKPLSDQEQAHLIAFLAQATLEQRPVEALWQLTGLALAGLLVLLGLSHLVWRRRLTEVRRPMVLRAARRNS
jgi:mono/diheme cytochrome c family protein